MRALLLIAALVAMPGMSLAQARLPLPRTGTVSVAYRYFGGGDHIFSSGALDGMSTRGYTVEGNRLFVDRTIAHSAGLDLDMGLHDRVAVNASIAWVRSLYKGRAWVNFDIDDGLYHGGFQDVTVDVRYAAYRGTLAITPFLGIEFPTRDYPTSGHAAIGRGLTMARVGLYVGWAPRELPFPSFVHGTMRYSVAEAFDGVRIKQLLIETGIGYTVSGRINLTAAGLFHTTFNGIDWIQTEGGTLVVHGASGSPFHNQFAATRDLRVGGGAALGVIGDMSLFATGHYTVWGENVEQGLYISAGLSVGFALSPGY